MTFVVITLAIILLISIATNFIQYEKLTKKIKKKESILTECQKQRNKYHDQRDLYINRIVDLECALKWWVYERMKEYADGQYGKKELKNLIINKQCFNPKDLEE
jgi:hypothetical protein